MKTTAAYSMTKYITIVFVIIIGISACRKNELELNQARSTAISFLSYYAEEPFSPHGPRWDLLHQDYIGLPGVEGIRISIIDRRFDILQTEYIMGGKEIYHTPKERLIKVIIRIKQLFFVNWPTVTRDEKEIEIEYLLSNHETPDGKYLVIRSSPFTYDIYFEDEIQKYLNSEIGRTSSSQLRDALINAGMEGID